MTAPPLPYALGCPQCPHYVEVSDVDADASMSDLLEHIVTRHAGYDQATAMKLLTKAVDLDQPAALARTAAAA